MINMILTFMVHKGHCSKQQETPESNVHAVFLVTFLPDCGNNCYYLVRNYQINYTDNSN